MRGGADDRAAGTPVSGGPELRPHGPRPFSGGSTGARAGHGSTGARAGHGTTLARVGRPRGLQRSPTAALAIGAAQLIAGIAFVPGILARWQPCFAAPRFDDPGCIDLQTDFSLAAETSAWVLAFLSSLVLVIVALGARSLRVTTALALVITVLGNPVVDYMVTPEFNGGYLSHDSPPGHGVWTSGSLIAAGLVLVFGAAGELRRRRRLRYRGGPDRPGVQTSSA